MVVTVPSFLLFLLPFKSLVSVILTATLSYFILQILSKVFQFYRCLSFYFVDEKTNVTIVVSV